MPKEADGQCSRKIPGDAPCQTKACLTLLFSDWIGRALQMKSRSNNAEAPGLQDVRELPAAVVSLAWVRANQAVPVCGGNIRAATRAVWSLSEKSAAANDADGSVQFQVQAASAWSQGVGVVCAMAAGLGVPVAVVAHLKGREAWLLWAFGCGALAGLVAAPWMIRRHPAVILSLDSKRILLTADDGRVCVERDAADRLVLVTGQKLTAIPGHEGICVGSDECLNGALLLVLKQDPAGGDAVLLFRHALPGKAMRRIARMAAEAWGVPLEKLEFGKG